MSLVNPSTLQFLNANQEHDFVNKFSEQLRVLDIVWGFFVAVNSLQAISHAWMFEKVLFWSTMVSVLPRLLVCLVSVVVRDEDFPRVRTLFLRLHRLVRLLPYLFVPLLRVTAPTSCKFIQLYMLDTLLVPVIQCLLYQPLFHEFAVMQVASCLCLASTAVTRNGACSTVALSISQFGNETLCQAIDRTTNAGVAALDIVSTAVTTPLIFFVDSPHPTPHAIRPTPCRGFLVMCAALQLALCVPLVAAMQWQARLQYIKQVFAAPISSADWARAGRSSVHAFPSSMQQQQLSELSKLWFPPNFPLMWWIAPGLLCLAAWPELSTWS